MDDPIYGLRFAIYDLAARAIGNGRIGPHRVIAPHASRVTFSHPC